MSQSAEFFNIVPAQHALERLFAQWNPPKRAQTLPTVDAAGYVLAEAPLSTSDLPEFDRSSVDGYALRAADTFGASQNLPAYLKVVGRVLMGEAAEVEVRQGEAVEIHTGGMIPPGADAVMMIEHTQPIRADEIEALRPVSPGENVLFTGEDLRRGDPVLPAGHRLRPQDIGALLAVGISQVSVAAPPRIGILGSGDELIPAHQTPQKGQIRDSNGDMLAALIRRVGGRPVMGGIVRDDEAEYRARASELFSQVDALALTAGSSVSTRDLTRTIIESLGKPGVLQHGLAVKPGKPTLIALCEHKPVIGLPGNPASAFIVARQIVLPVVRRFLGENTRRQASIRAVLSSNVPSAAGREDTLPVRLIDQGDHLAAEPIFGKSNLIYTLARADGLIVVPLNSNGLKAGTQVEVIPFDE